MERGEGDDEAFCVVGEKRYCKEKAKEGTKTKTDDGYFHVPSLDRRTGKQTGDV